MKKEEHYLQVAIHKLLTYAGIFHFSVPNGNLRHIKVATALKQEGVLAGVSDLIVLLPNRCIFVEIKNGKKGKQQKTQKDFQKRVEELGFEYRIWRDIQDCNCFLIENKIKNEFGKIDKLLKNKEN